ncbi:MAG: PorV/PorQ family protein, partial [Moheibacter sp.]
MKLKIIAIIILVGTLSFAQVTRKYSNEFLSIGVDARAFAMGNSVVANTGDVNSTYWNPAGLTEVYEDWQLSAMHAEYFQSIAMYDYIAGAIPLDNNAVVGLSLYRFGVDDILNTTELIDNQGNIDYDRISKFSTADYALSMSYAGYFFGNSDIAVGANAKIIYRHIGKFANSFGFGLDLGLQYRTEDKFFFGLMARDITTTFNAWSINEEEL